MRASGLAALVFVAGSTLAPWARADAPAAAGAKAAVTDNWATARARSLTDQGRAHFAAGHVDLALKRYNEALEIDSTFGEAYLALAALRESTGEVAEAERVLELGLDRIPGFAEGLQARGDLLARDRRPAEAVASFLAVLALRPDDPEALRRIVATAPQGGLLPVALGAARRLAALATSAGDPKLELEMRREATALSRLLGELDPVRAGASSRERPRRALARLAR